MILQALVKLYEDLAARGRIARTGWSATKISYALCLDSMGCLTQIIPLLEEQAKGAKTVLRPRSMALPAPAKRSSGVASNFLWDNSGYLLGIDDKGKPERSKQCFDACRQLHQSILAGVDSSAARAILSYFETWQPEAAANCPGLSDCLEELMKGANLVFRVEGRFAHEDSAICAAWQRHYDSDGEGPRLPCLVTGEIEPVALTHPSIKGVSGAQSSGAALVSFNAPAFCSFGREQNANAPVSEYAAFAYTSALNYLLADREHTQQIGDTTVVCWADGAEPIYQGFSTAALFGGPPPAGLDEKLLRAALKKLAHMEPCDEVPLDPNRPFYILGLAPNAARLSVRFFLRDSFGTFMAHVNAHHERMEIVRPANDPYETIPLWALLRETVNLNSTSKAPSPVMAGAVARAILSGTDYPAALLNGVMLRIRADHNITRGRAAILKAYLLKNYERHPLYPTLKEASQVNLNEDCSYQPYVLGRLFAVLEKTQLASTDWSLNRTIRDSYFTSAATTPQIIFAKILPLSDYHMKKLRRDKPNLAKNLADKKESLLCKLTASFPVHFTPNETICFYIGYHHENTPKKEEN